MKYLLFSVLLFVSAVSVMAEDEYCMPDLSRATNNRVLRNCYVSGNTIDGVLQTRFDGSIHTTASTSNKVYADRTSQKLEASVGDTLTAQIRAFNALTWMHLYIFIDYNQDKKFSNADGELVSYTHYNGFNSLGEVNNEDYVPQYSNDGFMPKFVIPANVQLGETRFRVICQWNSIDSCGSSDIAANNGPIVDFTIDIKAPLGYPVTIDQPLEGGTIKVMNGDVEINSGDLVQKQTELTVNTTLADGYQFESIVINNEPIVGEKFTVTGPVTVSATLIKGFHVTYSKTGDGALSVTNNNGEVSSGSLLEKGQTITIKAIPGTEHFVQSVWVAGEDKTAECASADGCTFTITGNTDIKAVFALNKYVLTYSFNQKEGVVTVMDGNTPVASGSEIDFGANLTVLLRPVGTNIIKSIQIDGVEKKSELIPNSESSFIWTINRATRLEVVFEVLTYKLIYNDPFYGTMTTTVDGETLTSDSDIPHGSLLEIRFTPVAGSELEFLFINDENYLPFVEDNFVDYTVTKDIYIEVGFKAVTALKEQFTDNIAVYFNGDGKLQVANVPAGSLIEIYDITGRLIQKQRLTAVNETISGTFLPGVYLVKAGLEKNSIIKKALKRTKN
jgi:hypothetical protein